MIPRGLPPLLLLFFTWLQEPPEPGKRAVCQGPFFLVAYLCISTVQIVMVPSVLVLMAIDAEVFPVAAVSGIVVMVVVLVVHRQQMQVPAGELTTTSTAYPGVDLQ